MDAFQICGAMIPVASLSARHRALRMKSSKIWQLTFFPELLSPLKYSTTSSGILFCACRLLSLVQNSISHSQGSRRVFRDSILLNYSRQIRYQRKQSFDIWPRLRGWQGTKRNNIRPTAAVESDTCTKYLVGQLVRLEPFTFFAHFHSRWRDRACCATRALRSSFT